MDLEDSMTDTDTKSALIIGASRGLGFAVAEEYLKKGWHVVATARDAGSDLERLTDRWPDKLIIELVDINEADQVAALHGRLTQHAFDLLFVNAGVKNDDGETIADVSTEEFIRVMVTNALSPLRCIEAFDDLLKEGATIGVMSSGQGSIANNESGGYEVYRGSKAALNMFMRSYAARKHDKQRTVLVMAPGWVRTDMGGSGATLSVDESIPELVNTMETQRGKTGIHYLDLNGATIPW
jgi:NAD(P)-dependent dehydrogenase (short-subunit alcohol dehydrogenase family)